MPKYGDFGSDSGDEYGGARPAPARRSKRRTGAGAHLPSLWWFLVGVPLGLLLLSFVAPGSLVSALLVMVVLMIGLIIYIVACVWSFIVVLCDSVVQLILCMFVPFYSLIYLINNFEEMRRPFFLGLIGALSLVLSEVSIGIHQSVAEKREARQRTEKEKEKQQQPAPNQNPGPQNQPPQNQPKEEPAPPLGEDNLDVPFDVDPAAPADEKSSYLVRFTPFAFENSPWKLGMGVKGEDQKTSIAFQQKTYASGISQHPPQSGACRVSFAPGQFKRFKGWAALGDGARPGGPVVFAIWGDKKKLWESGGLSKEGQSAYFDLDVKGVKVLVLETRMQSGGYTGAYAVWLDPWLEK